MRRVKPLGMILSGGSECMVCFEVGVFIMGSCFSINLFFEVYFFVGWFCEACLNYIFVFIVHFVE